MLQSQVLRMSKYVNKDFLAEHAPCNLDPTDDIFASSPREASACTDLETVPHSSSLWAFL